MGRLREKTRPREGTGRSVGLSVCRPRRWTEPRAVGRKAEADLAEGWGPTKLSSRDPGVRGCRSVPRPWPLPSLWSPSRPVRLPHTHPVASLACRCPQRPRRPIPSVSGRPTPPCRPADRLAVSVSGVWTSSCGQCWPGLFQLWAWTSRVRASSILHGMRPPYAAPDWAATHRGRRSPGIVDSRTFSGLAHLASPPENSKIKPLP